MAQIFKPNSNQLARMSIVLTVVAIGVIGGALFELIADSNYATRQNDAREQPIPFSHAHHVGSMGVDCRYCHTSVENSDWAVIPPTKTCMNCHSQIWINSPTLEPVRESYRTNTSIHWTKVYDLPANFPRLFQPQYSRKKRRRLRNVPWPRRSDGSDISETQSSDALVP